MKIPAACCMVSSNLKKVLAVNCERNEEAIQKQRLLHGAFTEKKRNIRNDRTEKTL